MGVITAEPPNHAQVWEYPPGIITTLDMESHIPGLMLEVNMSAIDSGIDCYHLVRHAHQNYCSDYIGIYRIS